MHLGSWVPYTDSALYREKSPSAMRRGDFSKLSDLLFCWCRLCLRWSGRDLKKQKVAAEDVGSMAHIGYRRRRNQSAIRDGTPARPPANSFPANIVFLFFPPRWWLHVWRAECFFPTPHSFSSHDANLAMLQHYYAFMPPVPEWGHTLSCCPSVCPSVPCP